MLGILTLALLPFVSAGLAITQRQIREVSEYTLGTYMAYSMVAVFGPLCLAQGEPLLSIASNFHALDWLLIVVLGAMSSWVSLFRSKAYQYEEPARLAVVNYFQPVLQLAFDLLLFGTLFSLQQAMGILIVLSASAHKLWTSLR